MSGLVGAAEGAPLAQGRGGSLPLPLEGEDLTEPPRVRYLERGEPTEPAVHAPTTAHVDALPVATGECTVEDHEGHALCDALETDEELG